MALDVTLPLPYPPGQKLPDGGGGSLAACVTQHSQEDGDRELRERGRGPGSR